MTPSRVARARSAARWRRASAAVIVLAGLALRLGLMERDGLWADEVFSLAMATGHSLEHPAARADPARGDFVESSLPRPASDYARYLAHESPPAGPSAVIRAVLLSDTSPPLYYLTLWAWTRAVGTSDAALRLFSITWWSACLWPLTVIARRVGGPRAILPALFLFCASPLNLYHATEGRMYSMLWFLALVVAMLTLDLHRERLWAWRLGAWIAASAAGFLTHYFFAFPWAACLAWLLIHPGRSRRAVVLGATALTFAAISPWYLRVPESLAAWRVTRDWLKAPSRVPILPRSVARLAWNYVAPWAWGKWSTWTEVTLVVSVAMMASRIGRRWFSAPRRLLWAWLLASLLGPVVFDQLRGTNTVNYIRYAISGMPAAHLLLAVGWARLGAATRLALAVAFLVPWSVGTLNIYREYRDFEPLRRVGRILAEDARDSDLVIIHSIPSGVAGVSRYMARHEGATRAIAVAPWVGQLGRRRVPEDIASLVAGRARVRLLLIHTVGEPAPEGDWLRRNATFLGSRRFDVVPLGGRRLDGVEVFDFAPNDPPRAPSGEGR